uniref:Peptidase S1 domain-containing protein n=1 Tax=Glossina palpalis gambiensis TaxID=67801 RepID=A0A1B0BTT8_9MUSC
MLTIPVQTGISKLASKLRMKIAERTDARVGIMNESVQGPFQTVVNKARRREIKQIRYACYLRGFYNGFYGTFYILLSFICLSCNTRLNVFRQSSVMQIASYVITVSHCVSARLSLLKWHLTGVRFGEWNSEENSDCKNGKNANTSCASNHINVAIEYAVPHSLYSLKAKNQLHDIALIRLAEVIHFTDFIGPICLPLNKEERIIDFKSLIMEEAGWNLNFIKIKVPVQGVATLKYHRMYMKRNIRLANSQFYVEVKSRVLCRSQEPRYTLRKLGSLAGALCPNPSNGCKRIRPYYTWAGLLSFYPRSSNNIKVYTKIQQYIGWILETIEE